MFYCISWGTVALISETRENMRRFHFKWNLYNILLNRVIFNIELVSPLYRVK